MYSLYHPFVHLVFIGIIALFPVVNPVGSAFIISPYFSNLSSAEKRKAVTRITIYAFCICTVSLFAGHWILELFGISIPVVQLAGGIMICKMGWDNLSSDKSQVSSAVNAGEETRSSGYADIEDKLFYPITFPVTTGAGTISVLFTLSAHSASDKMNYYMNTGAILLSITVTCTLVYIFYLNTKNIIRNLSSNAEMIFNRISAFLIFCVGLQIAITGLKSLFNI